MNTHITLWTEDDLYLFNEGSHYRLYDKLGAHVLTVDGVVGTVFAVWAPNAQHVTVMGDFNTWDKTSHPLQPRGQSGIWEGFVSGVGPGSCYKYHIKSQHNNYQMDKADPYAWHSEVSPHTASVVWDLTYDWDDAAWLTHRRQHNALDAPIAIYEMHLGSWRRMPEAGCRPLTYRELAPQLVAYIMEMGFTHIEFLPPMEHPFYGSWGYQSTGYFAPTSRYGSPQDFMSLIDTLHQHEIGVILDWVPAHFPNDAHGLGFFDGTHLYEHADPRQGIHPDWNSCIFNYGRHEVQSFLISSALFWLEKYHADGLRVDAVASMLYLDYGHQADTWIPNIYGGRENIDAVAFLRRCNAAVYQNFPDVQTIAEESTAWPLVSRPLDVGGLGFGLKWDMGWMHDTLAYMAQDPIHRKYHHTHLTFRMLYAFNENFVLPLSHDEVVHGKGSLLGKMAGDDWQKYANLRLLFGSMYAQPGKKLLFMGGEFGQWREWAHDESLDWHLLHDARHAGLQRWVADLNRLYRTTPALYTRDHEPAGFAWVDCRDTDSSVVSWLRYGSTTAELILLVSHYTPVPRHNYRVGVPRGGMWYEVLNSDATTYGGSGYGNLGAVEATPVPLHGYPFSLNLTLPPLAVLFFACEGQPR